MDTILDFAEQCVERLFAEGCRVIVVACHTVSCVALRHLQHQYGSAERRILGVTIPAAEAAVRRTRGHIGFVGTARTVASHTFRTEVRKLNAEVQVTEVAASVLAPIVEEGWEDTEIARLAVQRYLADFAGIDTLVLGCTHYPLLERAFQELTPSEVGVLNPAPEVAERFRAWRERHPGLAPAGTGQLRVLSSGDAARFCPARSPVSWRGASARRARRGAEWAADACVRRGTSRWGRWCGKEEGGRRKDEGGSGKDEEIGELRVGWFIAERRTAISQGFQTLDLLSQMRPVAERRVTATAARADQCWPTDTRVSVCPPLHSKMQYFRATDPSNLQEMVCPSRGDFDDFSIFQPKVATIVDGPAFSLSCPRCWP